MNNYYVYVYCDPRKEYKTKALDTVFLFLPFYVGYGKNKRITFHLSKNGTNLRKINKIKAIETVGMCPIIFKVYENLTKKEAQQLEKELIKSIGTIHTLPNIKRGPLTNMTIGGDGGDTFSGKKHSEETKQKMKIIRANQTFSEITKAKMGEAQRQRGIVISDHQRINMLLGLKNMSNESRDNMSKTSKGKIWIHMLKRNKRIYPEQFITFKKEGWELGFRDKRFWVKTL